MPAAGMPPDTKYLVNAATLFSTFVTAEAALWELS